MNADIDLSGVTLQTSRLLLRPWREADLQDLYAYAHAPEVGPMAGWLPHKDIEESRRILEMFIQGKKTFCLEYQGRAVGSLGVERYDERWYPEYSDLLGREIGYVLAKDCWGRGLMPEAVQAVIRYLFERKGQDFVTVGHFDWNAQSARVIEKCGFQYVKTIPYETQSGKIERSKEYVLYNPKRKA